MANNDNDGAPAPTACQRCTQKQYTNCDYPHRIPCNNCAETGNPVTCIAAGTTPWGGRGHRGGRRGGGHRGGHRGGGHRGGHRGGSRAPSPLPPSPPPQQDSAVSADLKAALAAIIQVMDRSAATHIALAQSGQGYKGRAPDDDTQQRPPEQQHNDSAQPPQGHIDQYDSTPSSFAQDGQVHSGPVGRPGAQPVNGRGRIYRARAYAITGGRGYSAVLRGMDTTQPRARGPDDRDSGVPPLRGMGVTRPPRRPIRDGQTGNGQQQQQQTETAMEDADPTAVPPHPGHITNAPGFLGSWHAPTFDRPDEPQEPDEEHKRILRQLAELDARERTQREAQREADRRIMTDPRVDAFLQGLSGATQPGDDGTEHQQSAFDNTHGGGDGSGGV